MGQRIAIQSTRSFGSADYRQGAFERLVEAAHLLRAEAFAGSVYLAGRGVEGMLRAVVWRHDVDVRVGRKALDTGHDLRQLLERVAALGLLKQGERDADFRASVQRVARLWFNNMRFASSRKLAADWRRSGDVHARRTVKKAAADFYDDCGEISRRCEALL